MTGPEFFHSIARQYDADVGRFVSRDMVARGSQSSYAFVRARVLRWTDRTGRFLSLPPEELADYLQTHPEAMREFLDACGCTVGDDYWDLVFALEDFQQDNPFLYDLLSAEASDQTIPPIERPKPSPPYTSCPVNEPNTSSAWCRDFWDPYHPGRACYREMTCRYMCQQCCYGPDPTAADYIEESPDEVSPVSGSHNGFCCYEQVLPFWYHILIDVVPWLAQGRSG